jgi:hypothetical protein
MRHISQVSRCLSQDSNWDSFEYKPRPLTLYRNALLYAKCHLLALSLINTDTNHRHFTRPAPIQSNGYNYTSIYFRNTFLDTRREISLKNNKWIINGPDGECVSIVMWLLTGFELVIGFTGHFTAGDHTNHYHTQCSQSRCLVTASNGGRSSVSWFTSFQAGDHLTPTSYTDRRLQLVLPSAHVSFRSLNPVKAWCRCYRDPPFACHSLSLSHAISLTDIRSLVADRVGNTASNT